MANVEKVKNRQKTLTILTTATARPISLCNRSICPQVVQISLFNTQKIAQIIQNELAEAAFVHENRFGRK
jgi:hypothetical protein